jgi:periplasmic protein TonB
LDSMSIFETLNRRIMEVKKTEKADLTNKSTFFFSIGLFVTLGVTVAIFENKTYDEKVEAIARIADQSEEIMDVPVTDQPPPPPPQVQQPQVVEVPDEEEIEEEIQVNLDVEMNDDTKVEEIEIKQEKEVEEDVNQIFTIVEEQAQPVGGMAAFYKFVGEKMKYPAQARRMQVEGRVFCEFVVNRDGTLQDVKVIRGIGAGCDEEAIRVIQSAPPWKPGKQRGKAVRSKFNLAIIFKLS